MAFRCQRAAPKAPWHRLAACYVINALGSSGDGYGLNSRQPDQRNSMCVDVA